MFFINEVRNTAFFKDFPRIRAVNRKISGQNGEILVTHALLAHHAAEKGEVLRSEEIVRGAYRSFPQGGKCIQFGRSRRFESFYHGL